MLYMPKINKNGKNNKKTNIKTFYKFPIKLHYGHYDFLVC